MYGFFSRLFGSGQNPGAAGDATAGGSGAAPSSTSPDEETKTLSPSNSTELSHLGKVAGFVQGKLLKFIYVFLHIKLLAFIRKMCCSAEEYCLFKGF